MAGFASPDVPAWISYAVVLLVGVVVARSTVTRLLAAYADQWAFAGTWWLFIAHVLLPIGLFWFLDYVGALQDTSLFAALVVAVGYRQIFAGGVQGIAMPGQTPLLWRPFEAWVQQVADQIATRHKQDRDRFDERVRMSLASDPQRLATFQGLAFERSPDPAALARALAPWEATPAPPGAALHIVDVLWRDLRAAVPEQYGYLLRQRRLVSPLVHWLWLANGRSKVIVVIILLLLLVALAAVAVWAGAGRPEGLGRWQGLQLRYHQWRFLKPNASERDRWRSREFLAGALAAAAGDRAADAGPILAPLLRELRFRDIPRRQADDILQLVVDRHGAAINAASFPVLIDSLRAPNDGVRLLIHRALLAIQSQDYPRQPVDEALRAWVPVKEETAGDIDARVRAWEAWWAKAGAG